MNKTNIFKTTEEDLKHDERTAIVDGIYMRNYPIREKTLSYIWGKYNMLPDAITNSLGKLYDIVEKSYVPDKNFKSLFDYTHDKTSIYSKTIAEKNITVDSDIVYQTGLTETSKEGYVAWHKTPYQGRDYWKTFGDKKDKYEELTNTRYDEHLKICPNEDSSEDCEYSIIPNSYNPDKIKKDLETKKNELKTHKKPNKKNYYENGVFNSQKYEEDLKNWDKKSAKEERQKIKSEIKKLNEDLDNEYLSKPINLLTKTSKLFNDNKLDTLVARFYGEAKNSEGEEYIDTSKTKKYGNSHGRNLLKKNDEIDNINGYDNPYCRVWTYHHQYAKNKKTLIRPFYENNEEKNIEESELINFFRSSDGGIYFKNHSVLKNGFVQISPNAGENSKYNTKK